MTNNSGNVLLALLAGAVVGTGVGILYAPEKGTTTRKKIKEKAVKAKKEISEKVLHAKEDISKTVDAKKKDFEKKLEDTLSKASLKADTMIVDLEHKLESLRKKNAHLQKN
ncbi:MAG: YtxH domain-containing protein [Aureibaculum sp.]|nr:YtxH domain-containing protein [Aureibaculum sp.]